MIKIDNLKHIYPAKGKEKPFTAIAGLNLMVNPEEFVILSGPNGSGKSTLFRILSSLLRPSAGRVTIAGFDLFKEGDKARRALGVVFQSPAVDKYLTVGENLAIQADLYGISDREFIARRDQALEWTTIKDRINQKVEHLSGGMARQVELAKCLLTRPQILLLDEPTTGLDPQSRRLFMEALRKVQRELGMAVLMTSHIFSEAEDADRVAIMRKGELLAYDSPANLKAQMGQEVLLIEGRNLDKIAGLLGEGLSPRIHGDSLRVEIANSDSILSLLEKILVQHRQDITSLAIKKPELEDFFIRITAGENQCTG